MLCIARICLFTVSLFSGVLPASAMAVNRSKPSVQQMLGQKLMLDLRYYCAKPPADGQCRTAMTQLPPELAALIRDYNIGGVILFAERIGLGDGSKTSKL